ncbi:hypothetical protein [Moraxella lacunata]
MHWQILPHPDRWQVVCSISWLTPVYKNLINPSQSVLVLTTVYPL